MPATNKKSASERKCKMKQETTSATDERTAGGDAATRDRAAMLSVGDVADMLGCSSRHVYRLSDSGRMPRPIKLGALVRWRRAELEKWIAEGCPPCRKGGAR